MRVVVVGATGNIGTATVDALRRERKVEHIVGLARRVPTDALPDVEWRAADIRFDDLAAHFGGADAVVHLAWALQPSHDVPLLHDVNVVGSGRVLDAVRRAGLAALVTVSSVGAYSAGPADASAVDESWPTDGVPTSSYSRQKAYVERLLDRFELLDPEVRSVRLRPGLVFQGAAAAEIHRLFLGRLVPTGHLRWAPIPAGLRFQAVHAEDVGRAAALAVVSAVTGPFNIAADPVLDPAVMAGAIGARRLPVPPGAARMAAALSWNLHLQPTEPGWLDLAMRCPVMTTARAERELGWQPERSSTDALAELAEGLRAGAGGRTPPLVPDTGGQRG